jgi:hypothetical protein
MPVWVRGYAKPASPTSNDTFITAETVCALLQKLAALNLGVAITVFLKNARYQECTLVPPRACALSCFLHAYLPNLNLIVSLFSDIQLMILDNSNDPAPAENAATISVHWPKRNRWCDRFITIPYLW